MPYGKNYVRRTRRAPMARRRPAYRKSYAVARKKRFSKYRIAGNSGVGRGASPAVFPQRLFKTFQYSSASFKLSQSVGDLPVTVTFRGNSVYDPDYAVGGAQPRWLDTFLGATGGSAPYSRYTVLASKIVVNIWQDPTLTGTNGSTAGIVSLIPTAGAPGTPPDTLKEIQERAFVRYVNVGNANSHSPLTLKHFCKTKALWQGINVLNDSSFTSFYNTNPQKEFTWQLSACNIISASGLDKFSCYVTVRIKYYTMLSQLNDVVNS